MNKRQQYLDWIAKTKRLNQTQTLAVGQKVQDFNGQKGIVVAIDQADPKSPHHHGTIYVWQLDRSNYGGDNCEHYTYVQWKEQLRILHDSPPTSEPHNGLVLTRGSSVGINPRKRGIVVDIQPDTHITVWIDKPFQNTQNNCVTVPYTDWYTHLTLFHSTKNEIPL